jgi:hypothetical protein
MECSWTASRSERRNSVGTTLAAMDCVGRDVGEEQ